VRPGARVLRSVCRLAIGAWMLVGAGCATLEVTEALEPARDAGALRAMQARRFDGIDEDRLLSAGIAVLQDLGFTIRLSSARLGLAKGVKDREAKAPEQVAAVVLLMLLAGAGGGGAPSVPQELRQEQRITVLLATRPIGADGHTQEARVSFQRYLRQPLLIEAGVLRAPELYERFFELLSKAVFLEAHRL